MFDNSTTPAFERSEFDALVRDLRERATQQDAVTKAEAAGCTADGTVNLGGLGGRSHGR